MKKIIAKIKSFFKIDKSSFGELKKDFNKEILVKHKYSVWIFFSLTLAFLLGNIFVAYKVYLKKTELDRNTVLLDNLIYYKLPANLKSIPEISSFKKIQELDNFRTFLQSQISYYKKNFQEFQAPYNFFLKYILFPSLNIWKDKYFDKINTNIVGKEFLDKNRVDKMNLFTYRNNFFSNVGLASYTQIENLKFGNMENKNDKVSIPIELSFISPGKRSFLFLIEKISITSTIDSIQKIDEFFWNLWKVIKENKKSELEKLKKNLENKYSGFFSNLDSGLIYDKIIGYQLYTWLTSGGDNKLIDDNILKLAAMNSSSCKLDFQQCLPIFRQKFNSIPYLAYMFDLNGTATQNFYSFLKNLSPVITISDFNFDSIKAENFYVKQKYKGKMNLYARGRGISNQDLLQIQKKLANECLGKNIALTPNYAEKLVNNFLIQNSSTLLQSDLKDKYLKLLDLFKNYSSKYYGKNNYQKVIDTFEIYRMLYQFDFCR